MEGFIVFTCEMTARRGRDGRYQPPPAQTRTCRSYCIRFLPWMGRREASGVEASGRIGMHNTRNG